MPVKKKQKRKIDSYSHEGKERANNPPVGLVTPSSDPDRGERRRYEYDPHLDPQLQWAGKAEHTSFEVPTQSLHVHERIDPRTIVEAVRKHSGDADRQGSLFDQERKIPLRNEIEFYKHSHNWSNRLIAGDSLLVMNSLLEKESMARRVQSVYMDPPYGIKYGSNFQPFVNRRDVKDGKDDDLTTEPEQIRAFRDTWELGIHSYLSYMRDRLLLARELLTDSGSCFVQISDENVHHVREIMDEVFGVENFVSLIAYRTASGQPSKFMQHLFDYIIWFAKDKASLKYRPLFRERTFMEKISTFRFIEEAKNNTCRNITAAEKRGEVSLPNGKIFKDADISRLSDQQIDNLKNNNRIFEIRNSQFVGKRYEEDNPFVKYNSVWTDTMQGTFELTNAPKNYVVQTAPKPIQRCILMTTDPGDLVFDPTCGSGTSAFVAEQWGRRWITCDTSRVALTLAKQRLMTASYDYYRLAHPAEGVGSGFQYKKVPHITLKSIANNEPSAMETLYDQPIKDTKKARITGPFTVEAVPAPTVQPLDAIAASPPPPPGRWRMKPLSAAAKPCAKANGVMSC